MQSLAHDVDETVLDEPPELKSRRAASQFVTFTVGENAYGIDIMAVREIRSWSKTTDLPDQGYGACGVLDIRGRIVEVFDLAVMLNSGSGGRGEVNSQVVLVVAMNGQDVGLLVDSVSDIVDAAHDDFRDPPAKGGKISAIVKQGDMLISILDLPHLLH